ncbi:MAG: cyclic nucleotide-binding domain-containing protein [Acidobacteria bacterium]|nr:cyclic nucleotide-binding domain-containing protein [Acidobacteriota bacterium]
MLTLIEKVLLLQNIELFSHVTLEQLSFLAAIAQELLIEPARELYRENDAPDGLYVVISGAVSMRRGQEEIDRIGPNGSFGVWALFDDEPRLTTAETLEESRLLFVPREDFYDVLSDHVDIVQGLFKHLVQRLRRLATVIDV